MFIFLFLPYFSRRTNKNITYKDRSERTLNERLSILQSSIIWQFYLVTFLSLVPLRTSKHCSLYVGLQDACASQTTLIRSPFICCRKYVTSPALVDWCFGIAPGCKKNIVNGKDYGTHAFELLRGMAVTPTTTSTTSSHAPPKTTQTLPTKKTTTLTIPQTIKSPATTPIPTAGE